MNNGLIFSNSTSEVNFSFILFIIFNKSLYISLKFFISSGISLVTKEGDFSSISESSESESSESESLEYESFLSNNGMFFFSLFCNSLICSFRTSIVSFCCLIISS